MASSTIARCLISPSTAGRLRASTANVAGRLGHRGLRTSVTPDSQHTAAKDRVPNFAFAFDIDGVLLRSKQPIPGAAEAIQLLKRERVPFILLTNGGGLHETERAANVSNALGVSIDARALVQSHTPFADLDRYKDQTVLVVGGVEDRCRQVAERYGFRDVVTPADIFMHDPEIWPFSKPYLDLYRRFARPLRSAPGEKKKPDLQVAAIFVFNDPRDWGLDSAVILDLLLSSGGRLGTLSALNGDAALPNRGYQQDGQPPLFFSNPDLWWASAYPLVRLGQGGFRESFEGLWSAVTGGERAGVTLLKHVWGKPFQETYEFAEKHLFRWQKEALAGSGLGGGSAEAAKLDRVYMVGDNPESDIRGANSFKSQTGTKWTSILVETGVHQKDSEPAWKPGGVSANVYEAVKWAMQREKWSF